MLSRPPPQDVQAALRRCLSYNPETGVLLWIAKPHARSRRVRVGAEAGYSQGGKRCGKYRRFMLWGKRYYVHLVAWFLQTGGKWRAQIRLGAGRRVLLGTSFATKEEAAAAYAAAALQHFGEFARPSPCPAARVSPSAAGLFST